MPDVPRPVGGGRAPLVAVGHVHPGTGFARVLRAILAPLAAEREVHLVGIGHAGPPRDVDGVTLHPANPRGGDAFGAAATMALLERLGGGVLLAVNDLWILANHARALRRVTAPVRAVAYVPLDGRLPDDALLAPLAPFHQIVAYTEFGRAELQAARDRLAAAGTPFACRRVLAVPHGVDTATFRPSGARLDARRRAFPDAPDWHDAFVILNANRPQRRKRLDLTLEGFARFARGKPPGVKLCLHHAVAGDVSRDELLAVAERLGIGDRVRVQGGGAASDDVLALLYAACDVGLNTAMGEGWGLVSVEHGAAGAAQVVPGHSACREIWAGAAEVVPAAPVDASRCPPLATAEVDADGVAAALERLYADPGHLARLSRAAHAVAHRPEYAWSAIADRWRAVVDAPVARVPAARAPLTPALAAR